MRNSNFDFTYYDIYILQVLKCLFINSRAQPLGPERVLLRGAMLRNTSWIFGAVIYTGHETKLMMNSTRAPLKRSTVDRITNHQVLMLFFFLVLLCLISALFNEVWTRQHSFTHWYIGLTGINNFLNFTP